MKIIKTLSNVTLIGVLLLVTSCEGFLDVNEDPTAPSEVPENLQLSALLGAFSYQVIGNEPARTTNLWMQQLAWTGFQENHADSYYFDESDPNNFWNTSYTIILNNARELNDLAVENENYSYAGISKVIQAWNFAILTDLWNEIPYSEAFNPLPEGTATPAYDTQEFVYSEVFRLLEDAISDFEQEDATLSPGSDDLLYGGNMESWRKLAYSLLARYHLRLSIAPGYDEVEQANNALAALENGFESNADDADFQYYNNPGEENPWYQFAIDGKWDTRDQLSAHYVDLLQELDDPRLPIQARPVGAVDGAGVVIGFDPDEIIYSGNVNGTEGGGATGHSSIGEFYSNADSPLNWMSYAEVKFIEAEATLLTGGDPQPAYEEGIRANMEKLGVSQGDIDSYVGGLPNLGDLPIISPDDNALEEIIVQKYIANFLSLENYNDWRRTGYPELELAETPYIDQIPVRYPYPNSEYANNAANVAETGIPLGLSALTIPVWWDTRN